MFFSFCFCFLFLAFCILSNLYRPNRKIIYIPFGFSAGNSVSSLFHPDLMYWPINLLLNVQLAGVLKSRFCVTISLRP